IVPSFQVGGDAAVEIFERDRRLSVDRRPIPPNGDIVEAVTGDCDVVAGMVPLQEQISTVKCSSNIPSQDFPSFQTLQSQNAAAGGDSFFLLAALHDVLQTICG